MKGRSFISPASAGGKEASPRLEALRREEGACALLQEEIYQPGEFWLEGHACRGHQGQRGPAG